MTFGKASRLFGKYPLLLLTVFLLFSLIVVGAYVAAAGFGEACGAEIPKDWPQCLGSWFPPPQLGPVAEYTHRLLAAFSTLFLLVTTAMFWRAGRQAAPARKVLVLSSILLIFQVILGGIVVAQDLDSVLVALHQAIAILIFGLTVAAYSVMKRPH